MRLAGRGVLVGLVGVLGLTMIVGIVRVVQLTGPPDEPVYGPAPAAKLRVTHAAGIRVELLPSHRSLINSRFDEFDISPNGGIAVRVGSVLYDMMSGERLLRAADGVVSFAFVDDSLVVVTESWQLAYMSEDGPKDVGASLVRPARIKTTEDGTRLLVFEGSRRLAANDTKGQLLYRLPPEGESQLLAASSEPILAAAGDDVSTYFSVGRSLFALTEPGRPLLVLDMPHRSDRIVGIAFSPLTVYFSTEDTVSVLRDKLVLPVVIGLGGQLRLRADGLYVLDARQRRLYRVVAAEPQTPAGGGLSQAGLTGSIQSSSESRRSNP